MRSRLTYRLVDRRDKDGPVGVAFANALANQKSRSIQTCWPVRHTQFGGKTLDGAGHQGDDQRDQASGADVRPGPGVGGQGCGRFEVGEGVIPKKDADNLVIVCGVFIHWMAEDDKKIYDYNYKATKDAIASGHEGQTDAVDEEMLAGKDSAHHPFRGF